LKGPVNVPGFNHVSALTPVNAASCSAKDSKR
jgi:hypothetical protein